MSIRKRTWASPKGEAKSAWVVDYRDARGVRRSKQFARKKEADAWLTRAAWEVSQGTHTADSASVSVQRAGELWIERAELDNLEPTTIASYEQHCRLHINPLIGSKRLSQLRKPMIEEFRDDLLRTRSRAMATRVLRSLTMIVNEAERRGLVAQNVCRGVKVKRQARGRQRPTVPTKQDLSALIEAAKHGKPMELPFVYLAIFGGLRASELRGLSWPSIDLRGGSVSIIQRADNRNVIGPPKSASGFRTIPLPPIAIAALTEWKLRCPPSDHNLVFPSAEGTPIYYLPLVDWTIEPLMRRAGLTRPKMKDGEAVVDEDGKPVLEGRFSLHELRHAAVSLWIEQRVQPKRVQTWAGHHSIQVTFDTYGHLFDELEGDSAVIAAVEQSVLQGIASVNGTGR